MRAVRREESAVRRYVRRAVDRLVDRLPLDAPSRWAASLARRLGYDAVDAGRRAWESGRTNRHNEERWALTDDVSVNLWLLSQLQTLRQRCIYESRNNAMVKSALRTWRMGVVGQHGPRLQFEGMSSATERVAEEIWSEVWERPEVTGQLSGAELLRLLVGYEPTRGEYLLRWVAAPTVAEDLPRTRVYAVDPRRLESPRATSVIVRGAERQHIILGVERDQWGRPLRYSFRDDYEAFGYGYRYVWVPAAEVVHAYEIEEAGQARGIPWLADCLDEIGELRDFDTATLGAARAAAEHGIVLTTSHPQAEFAEVDSEIDIEPHTIATMPPGYEATHIRPEHPATNYVEFRHERARSVGASFGMPLMMLLLDSSNHNYSSARFDGQLFARGCQAKRRELDSRLLVPFARRVLREAELLRLIPTVDARDYRVTSRWEPVPHVDPKKEAEGARARLEIGISTRTAEAARYGLDYIEEVIPQLARERAAEEAAGVSPGATGATDAGDAETVEGKALDRLFEGLETLGTRDTPHVSRAASG